MIKLLTFVLVVTACARADDKAPEENVRQKRLLFFDEGGSLVKTYSNPYLNQLTLKTENLPFYGNFLNPFFNFIRAFGESLAAFTIPVSQAIIEQIKTNPNFQNSLVIIPKNPVVEPNPVCEGRRTQIPSPNFCNNFLNCWDGWAFEQECPMGLLFSSEGYCDYAGNVDCRNRKVDNNKLQPQPVCSKDFEAFRNKDNCNEFFVCVNRQPIKFKCPADLAYSQFLGVCDYADRVDCKSEASITPQVPNPNPLPVVIPPAPAFPDVPSNPIPSQPTIPQSPIPAQPTIPPYVPSDPSTGVIKPIFPFLPPSSAPPAPPAPPAPSPPEIRPVPINLYPAVDGPKPTDEKPALPDNIFAPGCASPHVAMSRQEAIRHLQAHTNY